MSVIKHIRNGYDRFFMSYRKKNEIKKFKDPKRVAITESVTLTKDQEKEIDEFYIKHYGKKIPYVWHKNFMAHSGKFDAGYFPELLYIPEFEHFMNLHPEYCDAFADKNVLPILANAVGVKMPATILSSVNGILRDADYNVITRDEAIAILRDRGDVFMKPSVDSCSGRGCVLAHLQDGSDTRSGKALTEILHSMGSDFVVQEKIVCHPSISQIYEGSVNTFRIITYIWKGEICLIPIIMRIGSGGSYLDNAHAGGMFIAVDEDGTLHKTAMTEFNTQFTEHPDTHLVFEGYKIDLLPKAIADAKKMHALMPQIGVVNWDFTIDCQGDPLLIEANLKGGSIWLSQMAHGCAPFGEKTAEVLEWIRLMEKKGVRERQRYCFGKMKP